MGFVMRFLRHQPFSDKLLNRLFFFGVFQGISNHSVFLNRCRMSNDAGINVRALVLTAPRAVRRIRTANGFI